MWFPQFIPVESFSVEHLLRNLELTFLGTHSLENFMLELGLFHDIGI